MNGSIVRAVISLLLCISLSHIAESADPVETKHIATGFVCLDKTEKPLPLLAQLYKDGKWSGLQSATTWLLGRMRKAEGSPNPFSMNAKENYYSIVMVTEAAFDEETIIRYLYHDPPGESFNTTIPGIASEKDRGEFFQIFLTDGSHFLGSSYEFEEEEDVQKQKQLTQFLTTILQVFPGLVDFMFLKESTVKKCDPKKEVPLYAIVSAVTLVKERGTLRIADTAAPVPNNSTSDAVRKKARSLAVKYRGWSTHAPVIAENVFCDVTDALNVCIFNGKGIADWSCWNDLKKEARKSVETYLNANPNVTKQDIEAALIIEKEMLDVLSSGSEKTEISWSYKNVPKNRISFGLLSAAILHESESSPRAKVEDGKLVRDPLVNPISMAIVNIHPVAYDAQADKLSWAERLRLFTGATLTPDLGIGFGGGFALFRNVSLNIGYAVMLIDTPGEGKMLDQEVKDDDDPLGAGAAGVFFFGGSYSFD